MTETQETVYRWIEETFPGGDAASPRKALRLLEEVFELCLECGATVSELFRAVEDIASTPPWSDLEGDQRRPDPTKVAA